MKIQNLKLNGLENPMGYDLSFLTFSWQTVEAEGIYAKETRIRIWQGEKQRELCFDTGIIENFRKNVYDVCLELMPRIRYYWSVWIKDDTGQEAWSDVAWFETGKGKEEWTGQWIAAKEDTDRMPVLYKDFAVEGEIETARLYLYGVGLYEVYMNGSRKGEEYLRPGYHSYDLLMEYQTEDVTAELKTGENRLEVLLGEGWYKGRFGFDGNFTNLYGDRKKCIGELHIRYKDGREDRIVTDRSWKGRQSPVLQNGIYDGEWRDDTLSCEELEIEALCDPVDLLTERSGPPVRKVECLKPVTQTQHRDGYRLLDFGEMITGWVEWDGALEAGQTVRLQYGEVLQNDAFYNANLRTAKAEFVYTSDGEEKTVRPHFTYYGFRYVKAEGFKKGQKPVFKACRLMSDIDRTGKIVTSDARVNRLIENTLRSQKCNFLDIPTDCPQRDERMGWTGDVTVFAPSACFHMDCKAFFRHYAKSLSKEQGLMGGNMPFFAPRIKLKKGPGINPFYYTGGACIWGDVATVLPWTLYRYYGDLQLLREQYPMMCAWTDWVSGQASKNPTPYLWQTGPQLGDWLALDGVDEKSPTGATDVHLLASACYYASALLCGQAAAELKDAREREYKELSRKIQEAFLSFYFDERGRLRSKLTQTACAFLLRIGLYPENGREKLACSLEKLIKENNNRLSTGFAGTPALCPALSDNGRNELAYTLLLKEEYPGWLYEVNLGATTVWERWNSLEEDGTVSGTGMNSLNHYAYGSIAEWMYGYMCGFHPYMYKDPCMVIRPLPDPGFHWVEGTWESPYGVFVSGWRFDAKGEVGFLMEIPFNAKAIAVFPNGKSRILSAGKYRFDKDGRPIRDAAL